MILSAVFLSGCMEEKKKKPAPPPPKVTVAKPRVQEVTNYIYFTGYSEAQQSVDLLARVEGFLESVTFKAGAMVKKGDLLFRIDPKPFAAKVNHAMANLQISQAEFKLAKASLKRKENAYKKKAVSELVVLDARAELSQSQAEVKGAEALLNSARLDLSYTTVYAPLSGRISRNMVDAGNLVGSGGNKTLLATIVNYDPIFVYFNLDERSLMLYKRHNKGDQLNPDKKTPVFLALEGDEGYPYEGYAEYMDNKVDLATGTIQVRAVFDNKDLFILPGLFAKVRVPYKKVANALLVPDAALSADQRGHYLLTVKSDNTVEYKSVTTGALVDGMRVIKKGLTAEDRVIVKGIQRARPGAKVTPAEDQVTPAEQGKKKPSSAGKPKATP